MNVLKKIIFIFCFIFLSVLSHAQENTRTTDGKVGKLAGKIMVVPFEPKLYMSEIDQKVNAQTQWNFNQIREFFRHQLDSQLKLKLQSIQSPVTGFYIDSVKTSTDLQYIYTSTSLSFDLVDKPTAPTVENKKQSGIKNGQIVVEISNDKKFTNAKLTNKELIPYLNKKYKADYFVFINELDIRTVMDSYDLASDSYKREVTVHYTIVDKDSKLIAAGAAVSQLSSKVNDPKKIVSLAFSPIASYIANKFAVAIKPKEIK